MEIMGSDSLPYMHNSTVQSEFPHKIMVVRAPNFSNWEVWAVGSLKSRLNSAT